MELFLFQEASSWLGFRLADRPGNSIGVGSLQIGRRAACRSALSDALATSAKHSTFTGGGNSPFVAIVSRKADALTRLPACSSDQLTTLLPDAWAKAQNATHQETLFV